MSKLTASAAGGAMPAEGHKSRRAVFGLFASAPALAVLPCAFAESPKTMQALGAQFERAWAIERHASAVGTDDELDAAGNATKEVVMRILEVPAESIDALKVKARALLWCYGGKADEVLSDFFQDMPEDTTDTKLVQSILRDPFAAN